MATRPLRIVTWHPISMAFMGSEPIASIAKIGGVAFSEGVKTDALNKNIPVEDAAFEVRPSIILQNIIILNELVDLY